MRKMLERSLGFWSVFSISVGAMIGAELFVLPGIAAAEAGPAVILSYFLAGLIVLPAALSKAELGTAIPASGGTYIYLDRSMGPLVGTVGGLGTWFSLFFKSAFALVGIGVYLSILLPLPTKYVAIVFCLGLIGINIGGVKKTAKLQIVIVLCALTALALFVGKGFLHLNAQFFSPFTTHGLMGVVSTAGLVFISYAGVTKIASIAEEVKHPERNIPLGILVSLLLMIAVYSFVVFVLVGTIPLEDLKSDNTPVATSAEKIFGPVGKITLALIAVFALISMANAGVLSASRFPFAMSRDNLLPGFLKSVHEKFRTPFASILLTGFLMLLLIAFVDVENLAKLGSAFQILVYSLENLSVIIFRESNAEWYKPRFRSPGYPWVQLAGIVTPLLLLLGMAKFGSVKEALPIIGVAGISLLGALWYLLYARKRSDRVGSLTQTRDRARQLREVGASNGGRDGRKEILVPFYGDESESEIESRIRIAVLFSLPDGLVQPVYFEEVPDETLLEALREADSEAEAFETKFRRATRRWARGSSEASRFALALDNLVTHDAKLALFSYARLLDARWILMDWQRKSVWNFLINAHKNWWLHHSPCNVAQFLYRDLGEIQRIAVMTEPGPYDALLVHVADQLSAVFDAETVLLHLTGEEDSESEMERVQGYHDELQKLFRRKVDSQIIRTRRRLERAVTETENFDLLIIGAPAEDKLLSLFARSFEDKLAEKASCSVFQVQNPRSHSHEATAIADAIRAEGFRLFPFLHTGVVEAKVDVADKAALFSHIAGKFAQETEIAPAGIFEQAFWQRERVQNTAMGSGVAMPHAVVPEAHQTLFGVFTLRQPIDFDAPDKSEVDVCFVTVGPSDQRNIHLKILGRTSYLIRETELLAQLRDAEEDAQLADVITAFDNQEM